MKLFASKKSSRKVPITFHGKFSKDFFFTCVGLGNVLKRVLNKFKGVFTFGKKGEGDLLIVLYHRP